VTCGETNAPGRGEIFQAALNTIHIKATLSIAMSNFQDRITIEPGTRSGQPCIRGTRMTVSDVLEYLAGGMTVEGLLADFPDLSVEDVRACLAYAAHLSHLRAG